MMAETCQERNMRMGWGCRCHGETFCPDLICVGLDDDVPVYVRRDSATAIAWQAFMDTRRKDHMGDALEES